MALCFQGALVVARGSLATAKRGGPREDAGNDDSRNLSFVVSAERRIQRTSTLRALLVIALGWVWNGSVRTYQLSDGRLENDNTAECAASR